VRDGVSVLVGVTVGVCVRVSEGVGVCVSVSEGVCEGDWVGVAV
jgi:hypothetical protein